MAAIQNDGGTMSDYCKGCGQRRDTGYDLAALAKSYPNDQATIATLTAERDAMAAQVAALVTHIEQTASRGWHRDILANIPAAAAVYLAAHKACQALEGDSDFEYCSELLDEWRKAAGRDV